MSSQSAVYGGTWAGVPRILGHLNLSRERFREHFPFSIVFCLPEFALRYFIRRAPDFFDWRSGVYDFPTEQESVNLETYRLVYGQDTDLETYRTWTPQEQLQRLTEIRAYISESPDNEKSSELWHKKGFIHHVNNQFEEAIASYEQALKFIPDYHLAWRNRGAALVGLGRYEEAITSCDNALKFKPDYPDAWCIRGDALRNLGRYEEAITSYDNALKIKPNDYDIVNCIGSTLQKMEKYKEAIQWYDQYIDNFNIDLAIENNSDFNLLIIKRNSIINKIYSITERIDFYQQKIAKSKNNNNPALEVLMLKEISDCLKKDLKDDKTAYKFLFKSWKLAESLRLKISESLFRELQKIYLYPDTFIKLGKLDKANDFIADWLPIFKETNDTNGIDKFVVYEKTIETNLFCNQGNELFNLGRYEEAITSYDNALKINPDDHLAWNNRGIALGNLGRHEEAISSYDQALKIKPDDANAYYNKACTYAQLENISLALDNLKQAINLDSQFLEDAKTDTDFDKIRHDSRFINLLNIEH